MPGVGVRVVCVRIASWHTPIPKGWWRCAPRRSCQSGRCGGRRARDVDGQPRALRAGPCPPYLLYVFPQMRGIRSTPLTNCSDRLSISRARGGGPCPILALSEFPWRSWFVSLTQGSRSPKVHPLPSRPRSLPALCRRRLVFPLIQ